MKMAFLTLEFGDKLSNIGTSYFDIIFMLTIFNTSLFSILIVHLLQEGVRITQYNLQIQYYMSKPQN